MGNIVERRPWSAKVIEIVPAYTLGSEGNHPIAIVRSRQQIKGDRRVREAWLPLAEGQELKPGQAIRITPVTEFVGEGSCTTYRLEPV